MRSAKRAHMATECGNKSHSASISEARPTSFVKLFIDPGDWMLNPFVCNAIWKQGAGIPALFYLTSEANKLYIYVSELTPYA
jgi:hypothetical protein